MDGIKTHKRLLKLWDEVHLLNGLLRKMEQERLKILYYNRYHRNWEKKRKDLRNIDKTIKRATETRIKLCNKTLDLLGERKGEAHGKTQK